MDETEDPWGKDDTVFRVLRWIEGHARKTVAIAGILTVAVFLVDLVTPLGFTVWLLYLVPFLFIVLATSRYLERAVVVYVALVAVGLVLSPPGPLGIGTAIVNRVLFVLCLLAVTGLLILVQHQRIRLAVENEQRRQAEAEVQARNEELQVQNEELQAQSEEIQAQNEQLQALGTELAAQNERLREHEVTLRQYTARLAHSNEELQRFAYVASHDLQEPLRSIVSFSQLLDRRYRGRLDGEADEYLAFIVQGGVRMQALVQDLLQVSRIETDARPLAPTDAAGLVATVIRSLDAPIREAGVTLEIAPLPTVLADRSQLEQVFANLIGNALKYRRPGAAPAIAISAERRGEAWEFAVRDNGIGIEAEYFDRIFEMFGRLHTHDQYEGTGIGLAVVKKIVERHGGTIRVESVPGEGTTFFFTLPAV
jgi:signal transduction histidine kinase